ERGSASSPLMTVAPVVVSPEVDSNTASTKRRCGAVSMKGKAVTRPAMIHSAAVIRKPSRRRNSYSALRAGYHSTRPIAKITRKESRKADSVGSLQYQASNSGGTVTSEHSATMAPNTRRLASIRGENILGVARLQQRVHLRHLPLVHHEQDQVVARLDDDVVVRDQQLVAAHDAADGRGFGQVELVERAADHARGPAVAAHDRLDRLGGATAQRIHARRRAFADVRQQRRQGDQLRRHGDVDAAALDQ